MICSCSLGQADNLQDVQEQGDNIDVQIQRSKNVLFRAQRVLLVATHHELCVHDEVQPEDESSETRVHQPHDTSVEEDGEESEANQHNESHEETTAAHGEIDLRLEREQRDGQREDRDNAHCHENLYV